jgi:hypothetical protein
MTTTRVMNAYLNLKAWPDESAVILDTHFCVSYFANESLKPRRAR